MKSRTILQQSPIRSHTTRRAECFAGEGFADVTIKSGWFPSPAGRPSEGARAVCDAGVQGGGGHLQFGLLVTAADADAPDEPFLRPERRFRRGRDAGRN